MFLGTETKSIRFINDFTKEVFKKTKNYVILKKVIHQNKEGNEINNEKTRIISTSRII